MNIMDKQTVQAEGSKSKSGRGRSAEQPPVVSAEGTAPEAVTETAPAAPKRTATEQFKEITARAEQAQKELTGLANRVAATGQTQLVIDGKVLLVRKVRDSEDHYFYDPETAKVKKEKVKKGPVSGDELLV